MSNVNIDDQTSRLKQFSWEELDENFFVAVIFRSGRRFVGQRHFDQQLFFVQSAVIQEKWRRTMFDLISKSPRVFSLTSNETNLLNEIQTWHLNLSKDFSQFNVHFDHLIDFEDLIECSTNFLSTTSTFLFQPMTTLIAASRTLELWKEQNHSSISNRYSTGWIQIDEKILPFLKENSEYFLSIDFLFKENFINSSDEFLLRSSYIRIDVEQIELFNRLIRQVSSRIFLTNQSSLIRLDEFLFRLKRLVFIRFHSSSSMTNLIDYQRVMSINGGLITLINDQQRFPFLYIQNRKYFPHFNANLFTPNFISATTFQIEYLRLVATYEYLSTGRNFEIFTKISSLNELILIPVENFISIDQFTTISLYDFHFQQYQSRTQRKVKENSSRSTDETQAMVDGWWQTPKSSKSKRSSVNHFKIRPPIFF